VQAGRADGAAGPRAARGRLRTYLGIAPGVGKTYAMLRDGRAQRRSGVDTVLAFWQRHGRAATAAQVDGLEVLTGTGSYRGVSIEELDVDAVLARHPELALVDELAYANPPGARHPKRWQDVDDLLEAGIDVYTTLNVGNIESLGPLVSRITGVRVSEPVPDAFVRTGQVQLVDLAPVALCRRLAQGLVFPAEQADAALSQYFKFANLAALRELAGDLPVQAVNVGQSDDASGAGVARPRREAVSRQPLPTIDGPPIHAHVETVVRAVSLPLAFGSPPRIEVSNPGVPVRHTIHRVRRPGGPMLIADVLRAKGTQVITIPPDTKVRQLLAVLAEHGIGAVVVSHDGTAVDGIASERDIVRALARRGAAVMSEPVTAIYTAEVHTVTPQTSIEEVMRMMTERRVRHAPVVVGGSLQGIVSIGDIVKIRIGELETERTALADYITGTR